MRNARRVIVEGGDARVADVEECDACAELGYKLKPDSFDGTTSLQEFFSQFRLIARAPLEQRDNRHPRFMFEEEGAIDFENGPGFGKFKVRRT